MPVTRRQLLLGTASLALSAGVMSWWATRTQTYAGPMTEKLATHFNGTHFFDPDGSPPKSLMDVLRWQFDRRRNRAVWPDWIENEHRDVPPASVSTGVRFSYIGHASWLIQLAGRNILLDPVYSDRASPFTFMGPKRHCAPGIRFEDLPRIDTVLVTHGHYDHLDVATLAKLAKRDNPRVITPLGNDLTMKAYDSGINCEAFDWDDRVAITDDLSVTLVPTRHWSARGVFDRNKALWASFVLQGKDGTFYLVGDSSLGSGVHFRRVRETFGDIKLAILPIGAYEPRNFMKDQHMNPEDAVEAFRICGAQMALAHHHRTFQLTDEPIDEPEQGLYAAMDAAGLPRERFKAPRPGQVIAL